MPQDYAKRKPKADAQPESNGGGKAAWFFAGLFMGVFASFLFYLWQFVPEDKTVAADKPTSDVISDNKVIEIDYDFYDLFPSAEVPVVEEFDDSGQKVAAAENYSYLLQAGSFKSNEDANRMRAELILRGHETFIKAVEHKGQTWHRVIVGPFDSELLLTRARNDLAEANIESMQLRVKR